MVVSSVFFSSAPLLNRRSLWLSDGFTGQSPGTGRNVGHFHPGGSGIARELEVGAGSSWVPGVGRQEVPSLW